jgi:hypothetical protein
MRLCMSEFLLNRKLPVKSVCPVLVYSSSAPAGSVKTSCPGKITEDRDIPMKKTEHREGIETG